MIAISLDAQETAPTHAIAKVRPPAIVAPAPRQVSWGRIAGTVGPAVERVVVKIDGVARGTESVVDGRFSFSLELPRRDVRVTVMAVDARGNRAASSVGPVYGLPRAGAPAGRRPSVDDPALARRVRGLAQRYPGIAAVYVEDLRSRRGAAWNARARFPAASTLKLAIAIEVLRTLPAVPAKGSYLDATLQRMLVPSDNAAANTLLAWLGGSTSGGAAKVNATMRGLGLGESILYGGYAVTASAAARIPLRVDEQPSFGVGRHTTAFDLAQLHRQVHMAAGRRGRLVALPGSFTPADARFLLWVLARVADPGKLDRFLSDRVAVLHKAGWITTARHDGGLVYWRGGSFVAVVMTWNSGGTGAASDVLAGRVAASTLERLRRLERTDWLAARGRRASLSA